MAEHVRFMFDPKAKISMTTGAMPDNGLGDGARFFPPTSVPPWLDGVLDPDGYPFALVAGLAQMDDEFGTEPWHSWMCECRLCINSELLRLGL